MDFKAKVGPLPVWGWGLVIGGLMVAYMWFGQSQAISVTATEEADDGGGGSLVPGAPGGDFSTVPVVPNEDAVEAPADTNADWLRRAISSVVNSGVSTVAAQTALQKYLNGSTLSQEEVSIVNKATGKVGLPPEGTDTPVVTPPVDDGEPKAINWETKVTLDAPTSVKYGSRHPITATVSWVDPAGHSKKPKGMIRWTVDGTDRGFPSYTYALGKVTRVFGFFKSQKVSRDGINVIRATFTTAPSQRTKSSISPRAVVRIK